MKKFAALLLTAVLVMGSVLPCFADPSPSGSDSGDYSATDENGNAVITNPTDTTDVDNYITVEDSIISENDLSTIIGSVDGYDSEDLSVAVNYEVTIYGDVGMITVTVPAAGVTEDNLVTVLFREAGSDAWVEVDLSSVTVNDDGTVSIGGVTVSGEYAFVVTDTSSSSGDDTTTTVSGDDDQTTTTAASGGTSEETGDISLVVPIVLLVVAAVAIVILIARGKKEEN